MKLSHNLIGINGVTPSATNPLPVRLTDGASYLSPSNPLTITGTVSVSNFPATQVISGTVTANLGTIDGAATSANQETANSSLSSIDGKLPALASGRIPVDIGGNGSITITSGTVTVSNEVEVKNDASSPIPVSGTAKTTQPSAIADGQRAGLLTDKLGRVIVAPGHVRDLVTQQATAITGTAETTVLTAVAATFLDISTLVITNAANQATTVTVRDATAGTIRAVFNLAANGGISLNMPVPWKQAAVNTNWTVQQTGAGTINVFAIAVQNI